MNNPVVRIKIVHCLLRHTANLALSFSLLRFELDERHVLLEKAGVAHPLRVDLLREEVEGRLGQAGAHAVEPEVAARFA